MVMLAAEIEAGFRKGHGEEGPADIVRRTEKAKAPPEAELLHQVEGT